MYSVAWMIMIMVEFRSVDRDKGKLSDSRQIFKRDLKLFLFRIDMRCEREFKNDFTNFGISN